LKLIKINKCRDECPYCTGPYDNADPKTFMHICEKIQAWIVDADVIPDWCPLGDFKNYYPPSTEDIEKYYKD